jgi:DNA-binding LacI/PurR family transcriptional regulator
VAVGGTGRATVRDVAARAGVSPQTVSNYLNGRHQPRRGTRERVDQAILDLGYRPNAAARALRSRRVNGVALVMEDPDDRGLHEPLHTEFLHGIAAASHRGGHHLSVALTSPGETFEQARRILREGRADGLILSFGGVESNRDALRTLAGEGAPIVLLQEWEAVPGVFCVSAQDDLGAEAAAEHLVRLGHRRLAFVCGEPLWPGPRRRREGILRVARSESVEAVDWWCRAFTVEAARDRVRSELGRPGAPTGILAANDVIALGVVQQARELGLDVPGDLSVVGFNDFDFASWVVPPLTTVRIPGSEMGARAVELLFAAVERERTPESVAFQAELVVRASTGAAPRGRSGRPGRSTAAVSRSAPSA